jgi:hypothetical protein
MLSGSIISLVAPWMLRAICPQAVERLVITLSDAAPMAELSGNQSRIMLPCLTLLAAFAWACDSPITLGISPLKTGLRKTQTLCPRRIS